MHACKMNDGKKAANARSCIIRLPLELVQYIFAHLGKEDAKASRLICSTLADCALSTLFREVRVVHKRTSFERLLAIARQPHIARHVRSLVYQADIFKVYPEHYGRRPNQGLFNRDSYGVDDGELLVDDFWAYRQLCKDQLQMRQESYDQECLSRFFARCSGLNQVTIAFDPNVEDEQRTTQFPYAAFREHRISFAPHFTQQPKRPEALLITARALTSAGQVLRKLNVVGMNTDEQDDFCMKRRHMQEVAVHVKHLEELEIHFRDINVFDSDRGLDSRGRAGIQDFAAAASQSVQILTLDFPHKWEPDGGSAVPYSHALQPSISWPCLRILTMANASVDSGFVDLLIDRMPALEQLSLARLHIWSCSWQEVFERLSARSPALKVVALNDWFSSEGDLTECCIHGGEDHSYIDESDPELCEPDYGIELDFSEPSLEHVKIAVEQFIMQRGSCPDLEEASRQYSLLCRARQASFGERHQDLSDSGRQDP